MSFPPIDPDLSELQSISKRLADILPNDSPPPMSSDPNLLHYFLLTQTQIALLQKNLCDIRQQLSFLLSINSDHSQKPNPPHIETLEIGTDPEQIPVKSTSTVSVQTETQTQSPSPIAFHYETPTPPSRTSPVRSLTPREPSLSPTHSTLLAVEPIEPTVLWERESRSSVTSVLSVDHNFDRSRYQSKRVDPTLHTEQLLDQIRNKKLTKLR
ncbi:hypothetical protein RCL1_001615 [Eukaryota sp. TZLM3-RCL]